MEKKYDDIDIHRMVVYLNANPHIIATYPSLEKLPDILKHLIDDRNEWRNKYFTLEMSIENAMAEGGF